MGARLRLANGNVNRNTKTTIAHWIGSLIISLLFIITAIFGSYWINKAKKIVTDIIDYKSADQAYSTLKITKGTIDFTFVIANSMEIRKKKVT